MQVRNKPIEPPKKPEKAPFFLPSIPSLSGEIVFTPSEANGDNDAKDNEVEKNYRKFDMQPSPFMQLLQSSVEMKNCKIPLLKIYQISMANIFTAYICVLNMLQFQHLLIILKVCLLRLWMWSFGCFKS